MRRITAVAKIGRTAGFMVAISVLSACGGGSSPGAGSDANSAMPDAVPEPINTPGNRAAQTCRAPNAEPLPKMAGLPQVMSGPRPGPDILYAAPAVTPILQNHHARFVAEPIFVQGEEAYVNGEYLYQDYIHDDYGSDVTNDDGNETGFTVGNSDVNGLDPRVGDIDYPLNYARYGGNAADIVEFRIAHGGATGDSDIGYRITLNTLRETDSTLIAIVFDMDGDASTGVATLPRDSGDLFPGADEVIYLWGTGAEHVSLSAAGNTVTPLSITTQLDSNQMWVFVPSSVHNPSGEVGVTVAAGLYDTASGNFLRPASAPTATMPGVREAATNQLFDPNPSGIFNLAFRFNELIESQNTPPEAVQSVSIRNKSPNDFQHAINYDDIAARANRTSVQATGTQVRLFASHFSLNEDGSFSSDNSGEGRDLLLNDPSYFGVLQSYSVFIPSAAATSSEPLPVNWAFHSNAQEHWQYNGTQYVQQIGEALDAYVPTTMGRGPRNWYDQAAELDAFEVWADMARHFNIDANRVNISGYSMGGFASYRLATLYPDLWGRAFTQVGPPGEGIWAPPQEPTPGGWSTLSNLVLENLRNVPFMNIAMVEDELVPYPGPQQQNLGNPSAPQFESFRDLGYRYRFLTFPQGEHYTLFLVDNYPMGTDWFADTEVDRNPYHVTYTRIPAEDEPEYGIKHDHAYWVSELTVASDADDSNGFPARGTIDVFSHGCGLGQPEAVEGASAGAIPAPYNEINASWNEPPVVPAENKLTVSLVNLASATIDVPRSGVDSTQPLTVSLSSDSSGTLKLTGDFSSVSSVTAGGETVAATNRISELRIPYDDGSVEVVIQ